MLRSVASKGNGMHGWCGEMGECDCACMAPVAPPREWERAAAGGAGTGMRAVIVVSVWLNCRWWQTCYQ